MRKYILYWMQQAQRVRYNQALNNSIELANQRNLPLIVCFIVTSYPEAHLQHYRFMLQGIKEVETALLEKNIRFILRKGDIVQEVVKLAENAEILVMDRGFLRIQREWRKTIQKQISCPSRIIDTDTIIPVLAVTDKAEIAARTIRPKIKKILPEYLVEIPDIPLNHNLGNHFLQQQDVLSNLAVFNSFLTGNEGEAFFQGGYAKARIALEKFISEKLALYPQLSSDPSSDICSHLSPYLHFGQISSLEIALDINAAEAAQPARDAFLEQLIIRRELAVNFVWYNPGYDEYEHSVPQWAQSSLDLHKNDPHEYLYSLEELEAAATHDIFWNAAQNQMLKTGFMHNYMRMYWGKKIIEWTISPQQAYKSMCYLNNKYLLDGRDANGYAGIAWCFGLHDHPWKERNIFGKIRYMNAKGLQRKFNIQKYAEKWNRIP
ncbi:MAG: deoxyribodipyrimidine photo-lyase [Candidatus Cloacimonetes bacterium]|nr:deoxyribodipyrimidine photo-lyase [Candidatus Cloacimonadota bacterium]